MTVTYITAAVRARQADIATIASCQGAYALSFAARTSFGFQTITSEQYKHVLQDVVHGAGSMLRDPSMAELEQMVHVACAKFSDSV